MKQKNEFFCQIMPVCDKPTIEINHLLAASGAHLETYSWFISCFMVIVLQNEHYCTFIGLYVRNHFGVAENMIHTTHIGKNLVIDSFS